MNRDSRKGLFWGLFIGIFFGWVILYVLGLSIGAIGYAIGYVFVYLVPIALVAGLIVFLTDRFRNHREYRKWKRSQRKS